jgi:hypothetical protein
MHATYSITRKETRGGAIEFLRTGAIEFFQGVFISQPTRIEQPT